MSIGLDTSVALRLLMGVPAEQAEKARAAIASADAPVAISDLVVSETYFALRHHYAVPHGEALRALGALLADKRIQGNGIAPSVLAQVATLRGANATRPGFMDRLIHAEYTVAAIELVTFDRDLARLPGTRQL